MERRQRHHPVLESLENRKLLAAPLVITRGGVYSGTWESDDPRVPAVVVKTSQPVVIENSVVRGRGDLIVSGVAHTNLTVRNTAGFALNPNVYGEAPGHFVSVEQFDNLVLEGNYLEGTRGINLLDYAGNFSSSQTVRIVHNKALNIDGRRSDGNGGFLDFNTRTRKSDGQREHGWEYAQFVQLDKVRGVPGIEIGWNRVVNEPGRSRVEDVISIYKSSGTTQNPIRIHDNYVQGAYTIKPWQTDYEDAVYRYDWSFSGGGIMLGDGVGSKPGDDPAHVMAYGNTVVSTTNYGIALAAGHDLEAYDNRVVSAGVLPDGRKIANQNVGIYVWDSYKAGSSHFFNNVARNNVVGWIGPNGRNDWWGPDRSSFQGNVKMPGPITRATESGELAAWEARLAGAGNPGGATGSIAGIVFQDLNGDGVRDDGDGAARGQQVFLDLDGDGIWRAGEPTVTTTNTGRYTFTNVAPGTYAVRVLPNEGWRTSKGAVATMTVGPGETATRYFGVTTTPLVTGIVYMDANVDGGLTKGEDGLGGWQVFADANGNGILDGDEVSTLTDGSGRYALSISAPGRYPIRVVHQEGYRQTAPGAGHRMVTVSAGQIVESRNFGQKRLNRAA